MGRRVGVILCGGSGTRLWPLSLGSRPKQFHSFGAAHSLLTQAVLRANAVDGLDAIVIACTAAHEADARAHVDRFARVPVSYVVEPEGRNTAAAIAAAALSCGPQDLLAVLPSDHFLPDAERFSEAASTALHAAHSGWLVALGVQARSAQSCFGYIEKGADVPGMPGLSRVRRFTEKPPAARARELVAQGCRWNSGIFAMRAGAYIEELEAAGSPIPALVAAALDGGTREGGATRLEPASFLACPPVSIDHAVMETSARVATVDLEGDWSDLGTWDAVARFAEPLPMTRRVWGTYQHVDRGEGHQVKRLVVQPGARMSLQSHERRAEYWIVLKGTARVTLHGNTTDRPPGSLVHIPARARHRLENATQQSVEVVEVQFGDYLGEDDITRYEQGSGGGRV